MFANTKPLLRDARSWRVAAMVLGALLVVAGGFAGWSAVRAGASGASAPVPLGPLDPPQPPEALVFVSGAVAQPGLYRLPSTARVADAIAAAGGITASADPSRLPDLAARIHDGKQVNVPFARSGTVRVQRLDLNTATVDELSAIPGMPAGLPEAIVDYRTLWGGFTSTAELRSMLGVDSATAAALRPYLTVVRTTP